MARTFWRATAESVVAAVEAAYTFRRAITVAEAAAFNDSSSAQAQAGLALAVDLGLLRVNGAVYEANHILCRSLAAAGQSRKAAALKVILDGYEPYRVFIERIESSGDALQAARQIKTVFDFDLHQDDVKETLLSLGQYAQSLVAKGGGEYEVLAKAFDWELDRLSAGCADDASFEALVRRELGEPASHFCDRNAVIVALADGFSRASIGDAREAVVHAGNGFESFLVGLAADPAIVVNLAGAHGINSKVARLKNAQRVPGKVEDVCKWLGAIRNAADHGIDAEVNFAWEIGARTGHLYPLVACNVIRVIHDYAIRGIRPPQL